MKISDFVGKISNGLAKSNRFIVNLTPPSIVSYNMSGQGGANIDNTRLQNILLLCDSTQLPGISLNSAPIRTFGEVREIPYELTYEPITLTFFVDAEMNVKKLFDLWINATLIKDTRKFNYYDSYTSPLKIYVQDMEENNRYIVELFEAYPKTVSAVQLDYANKDIMKMQVTMMYKYWRSYQVAYSIGQEMGKPEFFDYTTNINVDQYNNNFNQFQQEYNEQYGFPESSDNFTGETVTYI